MKKLYTLLLAALIATPAVAKRENYSYDFYGFIRNDFYANDRSNAAACNELFYLYPLDERLDAAGEDLNQVPNSSFYSFVTRMGVNIKGANVGKAKASAKIEVDFGGYADLNSLLRIRQAYLNLDWENGSSLLLGQTWHPLFGSVMPYIANLSTGAPFQPFNRSPLIKYQYKNGGITLSAAAIYQLQYTSSGVDSLANKQITRGCVPELYIGVDYASTGFKIGAGAEMITLSPRSESVINGATYKVKERMRAFSGEFHLDYTSGKFHLGAKTLLASSLDHTLLLGGYGVTSISDKTGERDYTPIKNSTSWLNISFGSKWRPYIFAGYTKTLGSSEALLSSDMIYGRGIGIDQLLGAYAGVSYNMPHWSFALEYSSTTAWYGDINLTNGRVQNSHDVTNNRVVGVVTYLF